MNNVKNHLSILLFVVFIASFFSSCNKNKVHPVPSIPFDITINLGLPSYSDLNGVGGHAFVDGGSKGIIVYRLSTYEFVAFDLHSPSNEGDCEKPLKTDDDNFLQLVDQCDNARFSLLDGSPISGSEFGLRRYAVYFDGSSNLRIYN